MGGEDIQGSIKLTPLLITDDDIDVDDIEIFKVDVPYHRNYDVFPDGFIDGKYLPDGCL
jgi:hypothetical protein